jgi:HD-like signal output (HDOD) protein
MAKTQIGADSPPDEGEPANAELEATNLKAAAVERPSRVSLNPARARSSASPPETSTLGDASAVELRALELYTSGVVRLPTIPRVAARLVPMLSKQHAEVGDCVELIEVDRVLASAMLKCANSAAFFSAVPTSNIRGAVMRIGLKNAASLALSLSTTALYDHSVKRALAFIGADYETQWRRSVIVAYAARDASERLKVGDPELAFTGGLFRDVGDALAAFLLAMIAIQDDDVADMAMEEKMRSVERLRPILMREYIVREALPEALGGLCLAIDEPVEIEVDRTALLVRIILGLMTTEGMESSTRLVTESRGFDAAKRLSLDKAHLEVLRTAVEQAESDVANLAA